MSYPPAIAPPLPKVSSSNYSSLFLDILITIPPNQRRKIFQKLSCGDLRQDTPTIRSPSFFIYRMLPPIPQKVTIQLIWKGSFPQTDNVEVTRLIENQVKLLKKLEVVHRQSDGKLAIDDDYERPSMNTAMFGAACNSSLVLETKEEKRPGKEIGKMAVESWSCI
ncbi:unnamed protein product [Caenorhabditis brenneri]